MLHVELSDTTKINTGELTLSLQISNGSCTRGREKQTRNKRRCARRMNRRPCETFQLRSERARTNRYTRIGSRTFSDQTKDAKLGAIASVDDWVNENLEEPIEHLGLLGALLWLSDVVVGREKVLLEDGRNCRTRLEHDTVEVIEIGVVVAAN